MIKDKKQLSHSQNFLKDPRLVGRLVLDSKISKNDTVFEIGPGKGIITHHLASKAAKVIAIEHDEDLFKKMKQKFADYDNVEIIFDDFLRSKLPKQRAYKVFSNIPFNLTADILEKLTSTITPPQESHLIVQEDVAKKYIGHPYGEERLRSLILKPKFDLTITHRFKNIDFCPTPKVKIVMLRIEKRNKHLLNNQEMRAYSDFVAYIFRQHGKNLKERTKRIFTNEQFRRQASEQKFKLSARPGELNFNQWLSIFKYFTKGVPGERQTLTCGSYSLLTREQKNLEKIHRTRKNNNGVRSD